MPELPLVIPQHPLGGLQVDAVTKKADQLLDHVIAGLVQP